MAEPTTVRGWLETLPIPLRGEAMQDAKTHNYGALESCDSLPNALYAMYLQCGNGKDFYWHGVRHFVLGRHVAEIDEDEMTPVYERGYNAAKAAYGAMGLVAGLPPVLPEGEWAESPSNPYQVTEIWEVRIEGGQHNRYLLDKSQGEKELVDIGEIAELRDKAAKWDELQETLKRLKIC